MRTKTTPTGTSTGTSADSTTTRAVTQDRYGDSEVLRVSLVPVPPPSAPTKS